MTKQLMRKMVFVRQSESKSLKYRLHQKNSLQRSSFQLNHGNRKDSEVKAKQSIPSTANAFSSSLQLQKLQMKQLAKKQRKMDRFKKSYKVKQVAKKELFDSKQRLYLRRKQLDQVLSSKKQAPTVLSYYRTKEQLAAYQVKLSKKRLKTAKLRDPIHPVNIAVFQAKNKVLDSISQDDTLNEAVHTYYQVKRLKRETNLVYRVGHQSIRLVRNLASHSYGLSNRMYNMMRGRGFERTPESIKKARKLHQKQRLKNYQQFINRYAQAKEAKKAQQGFSLIKDLFSGKKQLVDVVFTLATQPATWILFVCMLVLLFFFGLLMSSSRPVIVQEERALTDSWSYVTEIDAKHTDENNQFFTDIDEIMFFMNIKFDDYELSESRVPLQTYRQYLDKLWSDLNGSDPDYRLHTMDDLLKKKEYAFSEDEKELYALSKESRYVGLEDLLEFPYTTDQLTISRRFGYEKVSNKEELFEGIEVSTPSKQYLEAPIDGEIKKFEDGIQITQTNTYRLKIKGLTELFRKSKIKVGERIGRVKENTIQIYYEKYDNIKKEWFYVNPAFYFPKVTYVQQTILSSDLATPGADIASRAKYIFNYFSKLGFTKEGIAAILGNWQVESGINPKKAEGDYLNPPVGATATSWDDDNWLNMSGIDIYGNNTMIIHRGLGLGQFTDTRDGSNRNTLIRMYAKEKNKKWYDMDLQLNFMTQADVPAYRSYLNRVGKSEVSKDVSILTNYFLVYWEGNPNNKLSERIQAAKHWYSYFSNPVNQSSYRLPLTLINLSSPFGWRNFGGTSEFHRGLDFAASMGTPIYAISDGVVLKAEYHYSWGNYVQIKHPDGRSSLYAHQSQILVHAGQEVHQGDKIGLVGSTGNSTGAHLHLEISKSTSLAQNELIDPATVLGLK